MSPSRHPFPPIVRWFVAPGLLVAAGVLAALAAHRIVSPDASLTTRVGIGSPDPAGALARLAIGLSAGAAFGISVSRSARAAVPAGVLAGLMALGMLASMQESRGCVMAPSGPLEWMSWRVTALPFIGAALTGLVLPHVLLLAGHVRAWPKAAALYAVSGLFAAGCMAAAHSPGKAERTLLLLFGALLGVFQLQAMRIARALAERLDRRAPPP